MNAFLWHLLEEGLSFILPSVILGADWDSSSGQESDVNPGQSSSVVYVLVRES